MVLVVDETKVEHDLERGELRPSVQLPVNDK